jgi:hypothetical protein
MHTDDNDERNVFYILDARMEKSYRKFCDAVDNTYKSTLAKYAAYDSIPRVRYVTDSVFDILHSRLEMEKTLPTSISAKELLAIQQQRDACSEAALEAFCHKVTNESDLKDPLVLAVFEAARDFLVGYLRLSDENHHEDDEAFATHHDLECGRQPLKSRRHSRSRTKRSAAKENP